jgi:hypothetical protein
VSVIRSLPWFFYGRLFLSVSGASRIVLVFVIFVFGPASLSAVSVEHLVQPRKPVQVRDIELEGELLFANNTQSFTIP